MWTSAFLVALVAGLWSVLTRVPLEIITILSKRENKPVAWVIMVLRCFSDVLYYAPVVPAAITGALLGNVQTGLVVGGTVQLMFIGVFIVGASVPPNPFMASILATAFSILTGASTGATIALVVPVAIFSQLLTLGFMSFNVILTHWADKMAADGNTKGLDLLNSLNGMGWDLVNVFPAFFAVGLGVDLAKGWLAAIPGWLADGLGYTGGVLPALGFGMLLLIIASAEVWPFFFIGFLAAVYLKLNAIAGAVLGLCMALVYLKLQSGRTFESDLQTRSQED
jgi:mannose/fructose/N-acetylgalactosamine-specific phosphotransferase system component IIC